MPQTTPPKDHNEDGLFEDIDNDETATFADAIELAAHSQATPDPLIPSLDFDRDADADFADAVELSFKLSSKNE